MSWGNGMIEQETTEDTGDVVAKSLGVDPQAPVKDVINEQVQFPWLKETQGSYAHPDIDAALQEEADVQAGQESFDKYTPEQLEALEAKSGTATDVMDDDIERTVPKWMSDTMKEYGILTGKVMSPYDDKDDNVYHTIQTGDTLSEIAESQGVDMESLMELNPQIKNADQIFAGDSIRMKKPIVEPFGFTWEKQPEQPVPKMKTPPNQKGATVKTWNPKTETFEASKEGNDVVDAIMALPKEDIINVLSFMPIPQIAGAAVPIKAIQAWLKLESKSSKVGKSGVQEGLSLGFKEKGLVGEVADFVQQIFMQKGMEKVLKHGFKNQQNIGRAGKVVQIKGPITKQELGILVKAKAKSEAKLATHVGSDLVEKEGRIRPVYMQFRGKKVEVDDLAEIENDIRRQMFGEIKVGDVVPYSLGNMRDRL